METNYVYLLQEREFIKTNEKIYKVGMTTKENHIRFNQYPKGSILLHQTICDDCSIIEKKIISVFKNNFIQRKDIGNEYFEGDYTEMITNMFDVVSNNWKKNSGVNDNKLNENTNIKLKVYECDICDKAFATKGSYIRHINRKDVHIKYQENVKSYKCACGKMYIHRQSLSTHKRNCYVIQNDLRSDNVFEKEQYKRKNYETCQEKYLKNDKQLHKQIHNDVECLVLDGTR
jgi:uncharacterized C2H2 Zn-finger protein